MESISADKARELLDYRHETGELLWKKRRRGCKSGKEAGWIHHQGYREIRLMGK
jgi:hypothetical protein